LLVESLLVVQALAQGPQGELGVLLLLGVGVLCQGNCGCGSGGLGVCFCVFFFFSFFSLSLFAVFAAAAAAVRGGAVRAFLPILVAALAGDGRGRRRRS